MKYQVRYTKKAARDMETVQNGEFEASGSTEIADRYASDLLNEISAKKSIPFSESPLKYRGLFTGFYSINFKKYKVFIRVKGSYIEVIRVLMVKRGYLKILFDEAEEE